MIHAAGATGMQVILAKIKLDDYDDDFYLIIKSASVYKPANKTELQTAVDLWVSNNIVQFG